jgi:hypothetical protein
VRERDAQCEEMGRKHKVALESMASELSMSAARNEDLRRKMSVLEQQVSYLLGFRVGFRD